MPDKETKRVHETFDQEQAMNLSTSTAPQGGVRMDADPGPVLIFGGPYGNLQATRAVLTEAQRLGIGPERIICTGDLTAYCADPVATIAIVRDSGIHVVMGNCDEQLAGDAQSCGCGFPAGSACEALSAGWFAYANAHVEAGQRAWLAQLPRRIDLAIGGRRLAVIHGSVSRINQFVFATTPASLKREELALAGRDCDGVIGGHCGLPFTQLIDGRLWHNAGVIGMPANDGTPRVWFSVLTPGTDGLQIEHRALDYDHGTAANAMRRAGLQPEYRDALSTGIWPSCDVLPPHETRLQGVWLEPGTVVWPPTPRAPGRRGARLPLEKPSWPSPPAAPAPRLVARTVVVPASS